jgi:hypothetical protein
MKLVNLLMLAPRVNLMQRAHVAIVLAKATDLSNLVTQTAIRKQRRAL